MWRGCGPNCCWRSSPTADPGRRGQFRVHHAQSGDIGVRGAAQLTHQIQQSRRGRCGPPGCHEIVRGVARCGVRQHRGRQSVPAGLQFVGQGGGGQRLPVVAGRRRRESCRQPIESDGPAEFPIRLCDQGDRQAGAPGGIAQRQCLCQQLQVREITAGMAAGAGSTAISSATTGACSSISADQDTAVRFASSQAVDCSTAS